MMAYNRGAMPHSSGSGDLLPTTKMPAALPNGAPPQWGQELDLKSTLSSHSASPVNATNGTRSSSQLSHPGSLSSHSSRDSSPAPSRLGVVNSSAWSPSPQNHSNVSRSDTPTNNTSSAYQQPAQPSAFSSAGPVTNHSHPGVSAPSPVFQTSVVQRMPPIGQVPTGPQQGSPSSMPSASPYQTSNVGRSVAPQPMAQAQLGSSPLFRPPAASQPLAGPAASSNFPPTNSSGQPQYSQEPSQQPSSFYQRQQQSQTRATGQMFSLQEPIRAAPPGQLPPGQRAFPPQGPPMHAAPLPEPPRTQVQPAPEQLIPGQQPPSGPGQLSFSQQQSAGPGHLPFSLPSQAMPGPVQQPPSGPGQQPPPGGRQVLSGQQPPAGPGQLPPGPQPSLGRGQMPPVQQLPPGPGQQPPSSVKQLPPGQQQPPGSGQQPPSSFKQLPPGQQQQLPPGQQQPPGPRLMPPGAQPPLGSLQMPPGQQPPPGAGQLSQQFSNRPVMPGNQIPRPRLPPFGQQMPPGPSQHMQGHQASPVPGQLSSGPQLSSPGQQMPFGQQMPPEQMTQGLQMPPGSAHQMPPGQLHHGPPLAGGVPPSSVPPGQWGPGPSPSGPATAMSRPAYPMQQGTVNPMSGPQPMNMPSQSLSGPSLAAAHSKPLMPSHPFQAPNQSVGYASNDMAHRRYPQQQSHPVGPDNLTGPMSNLSVTQSGYNKLWGHEHYDLLQSRNILPAEKVQAPKINLEAAFQSSMNCSPDIFRCTVTRIPETDSLLKKSRLPLGVLIHPFKDLNNLPVIQCTPIVRCRVCRTYINPFVYFMDEKHWKCNLCFRVNELPDEFHFDPVTKTYGEPMRRPEIKSATIEFIAPAEYMLRPPQPAVYLFLLDVSRLAVESGYLQLVCETLLSELESLPGDSRTSVGFITYDSSIHFYSLAEGLSAPQQMVVMDIDEVFLPCPENLLANLGERMALIRDLLVLLPSKFSETYDTGSALGAALQAAFKLMSPTGGRVTVFQCCLPNKGPGALKPREDPANRASKDVPHLNPATDFYKQLALEFSGQQTAVDMFLLNQQYSDLATISGVSRFSGGCIHHFPLFQSSNIQLSESFEHAFRRYLERKIGFEAVMRIRCSRGLSIHTFHGNFYVRSTDLLSLPNINPDAGFGMQVSIEENLSDMQTICFQAALLYTSGKGERRIRVHTLCLPIAANLPDILHSADQQCIIGLLAKMAVDRSQQSSLSDARDAFINVVIDALSAYKLTQSSVMGAGLLAPHSLRLLPLYILALLKNIAFRSGTNTRLDDRVFAMCQMKTLPLNSLIQFIYPDLYPVFSLDQYEEVMIDEIPVTIPPRLHLSAEKISSHGVFLLDAGDEMLLLVGRAVPPIFCENVLGVSSFTAIPEDMFELPEIDCEDSRRMRNFLSYLQSEKPYCATLHVIREDSKLRSKFFDRLIEDRTESSLSYYEFLQHIKNQIK